MLLSDFDYDLPPGLIAQVPLAERSGSRLLCLDRAGGGVSDRLFVELPDLLRDGDLLVFNDTRVIPARLFGNKASGGRVEVVVERLLDARTVLAQVRASKSPKPGGRLLLEGDLEAEMLERRGEMFVLRFPGVDDISAALEQYGRLPLPPYIERDPDQLDKSRYQTVYARAPGAVAAPTAGLHFDQGLLERLRDRGVDAVFVTLHVGAGTFQPVRAENILEHRMHSEQVEVSAEVVARVRDTRARGGRVIAVGTTAVRSLEAASAHGELQAFGGETNLFIYPGYTFRAVDGMITNFHLPRSSLLMLVCAFGGYAPVMAAYRHAVAQQYRFFSYGDAMLIL